MMSKDEAKRLFKRERERMNKIQSGVGKPRPYNKQKKN
jgi:hypothetical protein